MLAFCSGLPSPAHAHHTHQQINTVLFVLNHFVKQCVCLVLKALVCCRATRPMWRTQQLAASQSHSYRAMRQQLQGSAGILWLSRRKNFTGETYINTGQTFISYLSYDPITHLEGVEILSLGAFSSTTGCKIYLTLMLLVANFGNSK